MKSRQGGKQRTYSNKNKQFIIKIVFSELEHRVCFPLVILKIYWLKHKSHDYRVAKNTQHEYTEHEYTEHRLNIRITALQSCKTFLSFIYCFDSVVNCLLWITFKDVFYSANETCRSREFRQIRETLISQWYKENIAILPSIFQNDFMLQVSHIFGLVFYYLFFKEMFFFLYF